MAWGKQKCEKKNHWERKVGFGETGEMDEQLMYDHAIATLAMAELLARSGDSSGLTKTGEDAPEFCFRAQTEGSDWRYSVKSRVAGTLVTDWVFMALNAVRICLHLGSIFKHTEKELGDRSGASLNG